MVPPRQRRNQCEILLGSVSGFLGISRLGSYDKVLAFSPSCHRSRTSGARVYSLDSKPGDRDAFSNSSGPCQSPNGIVVASGIYTLVSCGSPGLTFNGYSSMSTSNTPLTALTITFPFSVTYFGLSDSSGNISVFNGYSVSESRTGNTNSGTGAAGYLFDPAGFTTVTVYTKSSQLADSACGSGPPGQHCYSISGAQFTASSLIYSTAATAAPEPGTWGLMAGTGFAFIAVRRRRLKGWI